MVSHAENGNVDVVPRFASEYSSTLVKYINMATAIMTMQDASATAVEDVIESNNTAYVARKVTDLPTLSTFMSGNKMEPAEAFLFIRPLFLFLAAAQKSGCLYKLADNDLRVNRYGQLVLDCMFTWDSNYQSTIMDLTKLYFQLITGAVFDPAKPNPENYDITLPPRLNTMIKEILDGDILYGSLDDFFKKFKSVVDIDADDDDDDSAGKSSSGALKWMAISLTSIIVLSLAALVNFMLLPLYSELHLDMANPNFIQAPSPMKPPEERAQDFFALAFTNPRDGSDVLDGIYALHNGTFFWRAYDNGYKLMIREPGMEERVLLSDVRPSFITPAADGYVYFTDGLRRNALYRVGTDGEGYEQLSANAALYLRLHGEYLYYTNHDNLDRLYRINVNTKADAPFLAVAAFETVMDDSTLFFTDANHEFVITSVDTSASNPPLYQLNAANSANLRLHNGLLYYLDGSTIRIMTAEGSPVSFYCPIPAFNFHPIDNWLIIIQVDTHHLFAYNLDTGQQYTLATSFRFAYVWADSNTIYAVDAHNSRVMHTFSLPR
jgi:hypothetical protein